MLGVLTFAVWKWPVWWAGLLTGGFLVIDGFYFASNQTKLPDGGWFPLVVAGIVFLALTTWGTGRRLVKARLAEDAMSLEQFVHSSASRIKRVAGTAVFLNSTQDGVPPALLHNVKHNKILHERNVITTVSIAKIPHVPIEERLSQKDLGEGFYKIVLRYGFMDEIDVPEAMRTCATWDPPIKKMDTSFFLGRQTLIASSRPGMAIWRGKLFAWMVRNAESAMDFFKLPPNRVVELGSQVEI
jgi:KUP system potassium uptake protein